jgi:hypothetical protein
MLLTHNVKHEQEEELIYFIARMNIAMLVAPNCRADRFTY